MTRVLGVVMCGVLLVAQTSLCLADEKDPFQIGAKFHGKRTFLDPKGNKLPDEPQKWSLKVTERTEKRFKGEITLHFETKTFDYPVSGSAPNSETGEVKFVGEKGHFKQFFEGKIVKGEIGLDFHGTTVNGGKIRGKATLRPEEAK